MKHLKALLLLSLISIEIAFAQAPQTLVSDYKLDFAVPDIPAYKVLGVESSNILRPSNEEELTAIFSQLTEGSSFILPGSFGAEINPNLLINRKMTLKDFNGQKRFVRSFRLSLASNRASEENTVTDVGIGIRFSIINEGDYKRDNNYQYEIDTILGTFNRNRQALADEFRKKNNLTPNMFINNPDLVNQENEYIESKIKDQASTNIRQVNKSYEDANWNARKWDIAFATRGTSQDSLAKNVEFKKFAFWTTYANGIGNWGQWLLGLHYNYDELMMNNNLWSLNGRVYAGKNRIKGFLEAQYKSQSFLDENAFLFNGGFELNVTHNLWADINFGLESVSNNTEEDGEALKSDFNIKYRF